MSCDYCFVVYNLVPHHSITPRGATLPATSFFMLLFISTLTFNGLDQSRCLWITCMWRCPYLWRPRFFRDGLGVPGEFGQTLSDLLKGTHILECALPRANVYLSLVSFWHHVNRFTSGCISTKAFVIGTNAFFERR